MHTRKPNFGDFLKDFGDAVGGVALGYGVALHSTAHMLFGTVLILLSIFLRFYFKIKF